MGENLDIESAELIVEVKLDVLDDPLASYVTVTYTLGQLTRYATAHLAAQFRTHVFSILVFPKWARLMRWDRAEAVPPRRVFLEIQPCRCRRARSRPYCHSF
jgi:hypothetical protein